MTHLRLALAVLAALAVTGPVWAEEKGTDAEQLAGTIDRLIAAEWQVHKVKPAAQADDAEFCRRIYLDIAGRIPRVAETQEFLEDKDPNKRAKLVERLLDGPGYVQNFTNVWRAMMVPQANNNIQLQFLVPQFENWLRKQLRDNAAYDQMVRDILTQPIAGGGRGIVRQPQNATDVSPAAFFQVNENKAENLAASTSRLFLGVKLECAQCHDHPFQADLKKKKFWEYAAFFGGIQTQGMGAFAPAQDNPKLREIKIPNTDKVVQAKYLDGSDPQWEDNAAARQTLAKWMTAKGNPYFARATVNKLWAHFFGLGIIEPLDEPGPSNPPSHPELLDELAKQFAAHDFDLKFVIRAIVLSKTYQLSSTASDDSQDEARLFARAPIKGLTGEQLFDSLALATGYREPPANPNQRVAFFGNNTPRAEFLQKFANHQDKKTEVQTSILQALALMNGKFIADATSVEKSETLAAIIDFPAFTTGDRIEKLYLAALSRKPRPQELERLVKYVDKGGANNNPKAALADVFWALLNSSEFILNH
jgi:hypothetical protein